MPTVSQVFLSYAPEDEITVERIYDDLSKLDFKPWMRKRDLVAGELPASATKHAIRRSSFFLVFLSARSVGQRGPLRREMADALDVWQEMLDSDIYLIPVRLEECELPEDLRDFLPVDLFQSDGWQNLIKALEVGQERRAEPISTESVEKISYRFFAERYGFGYDQLNISCDIMNDGSAQVTRNVFLQAFSILDAINTFIVVPEPDPSGIYRTVDSPEPVSKTVGKSLTCEQLESRNGISLAHILVAPSLRPRERLEYLLVHKVSPGTYAIGLTSQQLKERETNYDYFAWTINRPTKSLQLTVRFPLNHRPVWQDIEVLYADALYGGTGAHIPHQNERARLRGPYLKDPSPKKYELVLDVEYPMVGLVYVVKWQPLSR